MVGEQIAIWEWDDTNNVWVKAPAVVRTVRAVATGPAVARACKLYWIACSPDSAGSEFQLTDADAPGGVEVYCHFDDDRHSEHIHISPPMQFDTGIYVEKFDKIQCLHFGYV